jgi:hypothetical protein
MARFDRMETSLQRPCQLRLGQSTEPHGLGKSCARGGETISEKLLGVCLGRRAGGEGLVDVGALERLEPGIRDQVRALAGGLGRSAFGFTRILRS